jgi:hypothetical protein
MADKADWSDSYLRHLIDVCKGEIECMDKYYIKVRRKDRPETNKDTIQEQARQDEKRIYCLHGV